MYLTVACRSHAPERCVCSGGLPAEKHMDMITTIALLLYANVAYDNIDASLLY